MNMLMHLGGGGLSMGLARLAVIYDGSLKQGGKDEFQ